MKIRLANKLSQSVTFAIRGKGGLVEMRLEPFATSDVLDDSVLGVHAKQLIESGHLKTRKP